MAELRVKGTGTIKLFESDNTSSVTIASPASLSANKTITLPDGDVTLVAGTMSTSDGITEMDEWLITASYSGDADPITANWARNASAAFDKIGTGMAESSGIFTFPSTGIWKIEFFARAAQGSADERDIAAYIEQTVNDSSYNNLSATESSIYKGSGSWFQSFFQAGTFDVSDTANRKVRFKIVVNAATTEIQADGSFCTTGARFIRLGDT